MTTWCGYCKQTVMFLNQNNIYYTAYDIEKDAAAAKIYREYGGQGVPVVVVADKTVIKGYNPSAIIAALK